MDIRIVTQPLTRLLSTRKESNKVSSSPLNLYAAPTTALSTPPQPSPHPPAPLSPFALATALELDDRPNVESTNEPFVDTTMAFTERLASIERLRVQVDSTNHIHAWLSDVPDTTVSPLSRNPSVRKRPTLQSGQRMTGRVTSRQLRGKDEESLNRLPSTITTTEEASDRPESAGSSPVREHSASGTTGSLKPMTPDSAMLGVAEARARIEAYQRTAEYQEYLQDMEILTSFTGALANKSLKERIEFFESLEAKAVRKRVTDYEATGPHKVFLADLALVETYGC